MKIVNIIGGLGNQMFQYAFAYVLKEKFPSEKVLIDTSHFKHLFIKKIKSANLHNGFEVEKAFPNANLKHASFLDLMKVTWYLPNYVLSRIVRRALPQRKTEYIQTRQQIFAYTPEVLDIKGNCYYEGVFEAAKYYTPYRDKIREMYAHPVPDSENKAFIEKMENEDSVGIHVRRGDYVYAPAFNGICDLDYYKQAIDKILGDKKARSFYIFSNDIEWCKENISPMLKNNPVTFVTHNTGKKSCWDMFLMSHCKDLIIANSSFSWWAAFLNSRGGITIAPKIWVRRDAPCDIWLDDWIRV